MEESTYFSRIDVARNSFVISAKKGKFLTKNRTFTMDKHGFKDFEQVIKELKEEVVIGMEPTRIYHNNLLNFIKTRDYNSVEKLPGIFNQKFLSVLLGFGGAPKIKRIPKTRFKKLLNQFSNKDRGRKSNLTLKKIYELACSSIAGDWPDCEELLKTKIRWLNSLLKEKEHIAKLIEEKGKKFFKREIEILCSIPGVGKESAIYLMAELVDIKRFEHYRKFVGFCGLAPVIKQSGRFKANLRISKSGNAHARRIIWIMTGCVKRICPYFREYYLKRRAEGKSYKEAVVATSTKLLRTIFALLNENRYFR